MNSTKTSGRGGLGGKDVGMYEAEVNAGADSMDGLVQPVNMMSKKVDLKALRSTLSDGYGSVSDQRSLFSKHALTFFLSAAASCFQDHKNGQSEPAGTENKG